MINKIQDNDFELAIKSIEDNSIDSMDDFKTSKKYITFNPNTNRLSVSNPKVNLAKKNTRMSSNNDEDNDSGFFTNENNENKSSNLLHMQPPIQEGFKDFKFQKKFKNDKKENNNNNIYMDEINQIFTTPTKNNDNNNIKKINFSEVRRATKSVDLSNLNMQITDDNAYNSYSDRSKSQNLKNKENDNDSSSKTKKKKYLVLKEIKKKSKNNKRSSLANKDKQEKKDEEEEKIIRKDKNGVPICKKNKRKVKISFERPFVNVTNIECYKKYNVMIGMPKDDNFMGEHCQCCTII